MNSSHEILEILLQYIQKNDTTEKQCLIACNINTSFLTDWKGGKLKNPSYDKIVKLAKHLNIDLNLLFLGKETESSNRIDLTNTNETIMLDLFHMLSEKEQDRIIGRLENMVEESQKSKNKDVV